MNVSPSGGLTWGTGRGTALACADGARTLACSDSATALAWADGAAKIKTVGRLGGVRSLVHVCVAGVGSTLPAPSIARTLNVCEPEPGTSTG